jgi:hypothetical protein
MALSDAERQARYRAKRTAAMNQLKAELERLRNGHGQPQPEPLAAAAQQNLDAELHKLRQENEQLRAQLRGRPADSLGLQGKVDELRNLVERLRRENAGLKAARRQQFNDASLDDAKARAEVIARRFPPGDRTGEMMLLDIEVAIQKLLEERRKGYARVENKISKLEARAPSKADSRRQKLETMAARGATEGERAAAAEALKRLKLEGRKRSTR